MIKRLTTKLNKFLFSSAVLALPFCSAQANESGFDKHVFVDSASFVLVAESQSSLASIFGHSFLKIEGKGKKHALSYYNSIDGTFSSYMDVILGKSKGIYVLMPYDEMKDSYVKKEKRSLWEFKLSLDEEDRQILREQIRGLECKTDEYNFFYNNCSSRLEKLLEAVDGRFGNKSVKGIVTPLEYAKHLLDEGLVEEIKYIPSKKVEHLPEIYEYHSVSRTSFGFGSEGFYFSFSPIYHDKSQAVYVEREVDSRILSLDLRVNRDFDLKFDKLDVFTLTAYDSLTTSIDIGMEKGFRGGIGIGTSFYHKNLLLYVIPTAGYRYGKGFVSSKIGANMKMFSKLSASLQYEVGSDHDALEAGLNMKISNDIEMQAKYAHKKCESDFYVGIGIYF